MTTVKNEKYTYTDGQYFCNGCDASYEGACLAEECYDNCPGPDDVPKFAQPRKGLAPLWVYPHPGKFEGDSGYLTASTIDEMSLNYEPGLSMASVRISYARALVKIFDISEVEASQASVEIQGAWVVPNYVWPMIGAAFDVNMGTDSVQYAVNESVQRMVATQAILHLGKSNPYEAQ